MTAQEEVKPTLESAETCKECHEQHYLEWTNSGHAHFSREQNLPFLTLSQRAGAGNKDISRCQACHEPLRQFSDAVSDPDIIAKERITCAFCHSVEIDHPHPKFKLHPSGAKLGQLEDVDSPEHPVAYSKELMTSDFCLVCHHKSRDDHRQLRIQFPIEQITCQNCHMPLRKEGSKEHVHTFLGRYSEEMLQKAVAFDVAVEEVDAGFQIDVKMKNIVNAHAVSPAPKGYSHLVLMVSAQDDNGATVWKNWEFSPAKKPKKSIFATIKPDSRGNTPAAIFIKATESQEFRYLPENKSIKSVEAKLLAYALAPGVVTRMGAKDDFYTKGRLMALKRIALDSGGEAGAD